MNDELKLDPPGILDVFSHLMRMPSINIINRNPAMQDFLVLWKLCQLPSATENNATNLSDLIVYYINICL